MSVGEGEKPRLRIERIYDALDSSPIFKLLSLVSSLISSVIVIIGVILYFWNGADRARERDVALWANLSSPNTGQKYALELFASDDVSMNSLRIEGDDLSRINIPGAQLTYGQITGSNLTNADLRNVDFGGTTLRNDDFSFSDLAGANLAQINSNKPDASNAFTGAILPDLSFSEIKKFQSIACVYDSTKIMDLPFMEDGAPIQLHTCKPKKAVSAKCVRYWCKSFSTFRFSHLRVNSEWYIVPDPETTSREVTPVGMVYVTFIVTAIHGFRAPKIRTPSYTAN